LRWRTDNNKQEGREEKDKKETNKEEIRREGREWG
jgi:hypothetical protein